MISDLNLFIHFITKLVVEQPWLHRICKIFLGKECKLFGGIKIQKTTPSIPPDPAILDCPQVEAGQNIQELQEKINKLNQQIFAKPESSK